MIKFNLNQLKFIKINFNQFKNDQNQSKSV